MPSYQEIDSRLRSVEDKIDFVMKSFTVKRQERSLIVPGQVFETTMTLAQLYREIKGFGGEVVEGLLRPSGDPESDSGAEAGPTPSEVAETA